MNSHSVVPWLCTVDTWVPWSRVVCLLTFSWQGTLREVESLTAALSQQVRSLRAGTQGRRSGRLVDSKTTNGYGHTVW